MQALAERSFRWHPLGIDIPVGWRVAEQVASHHHAHAVLIEPDPDNAVALYAAEVADLRPVPVVMGD